MIYSVQQVQKKRFQIFRTSYPWASQEFSRLFFLGILMICFKLLGLEGFFLLHLWGLGDSLNVCDRSYSYNAISSS